MTELYRCRIHDHYLAEIPLDAVVVPSRRGIYILYRFADGSLHDIRKIVTTATRHQQYWHSKHSTNGRKKLGCKLCFPPEQPQQPPQAVPEPQIVMGHGSSDVRRIAEEIDQQVDQQQVLRSALTELLVEPEKKSTPADAGNIMQAAFNRSNKNDYTQ